MKLKKAKILRGDIASTNMEWMCGELENKNKDKYLACMDITVPSNSKSIFFVNKGQPPEKFDFFKQALDSFEQIAFGQICSMEWDKLENGDRISLPDEMEEKIRDWGGRIWMGGSITQIKKGKPGVHHLEIKPQSVEERQIEGRHLIYNKKNEEF